MLTEQKVFFLCEIKKKKKPKQPRHRGKDEIDDGVGPRRSDKKEHGREQREKPIVLREQISLL